MTDDKINEIRNRLGIVEETRTPEEIRKQTLLDKIDLYKKQRDDKIKQAAQAKIQSRPWYQKAIDIATPGAQFREPEKGETALGDIAGGLKGAGKGVLSTLTGASALGERMIKGIGRAVTPKAYEEALEFAPEEKTSAEQLIKEEWRTPKTSEERIGFGVLHSSLINCSAEVFSSGAN